MSETYLACPGCESAREIVYVVETLTREKYPLRELADLDYPEAYEPELEPIDTNRDDAKFLCEDCGYESHDPDDFREEDEAV